MKKLIILVFCLLLSTCTVCADNLFESTQSVLTRLDIKTDDDLSPLMHCKNYSFIHMDYRPVIATGLKSGVLSLKDGVILPESDDLLPLYSGISAYSIKSNSFKLVAGEYSKDRISGATVNSETLCLDPLNENDLYTALIDKNHKAVIVWRSGDVILPELYRGTVYICGDGNLVMSNVERYSFDSWINVTTGKEYIELSCKDALNFSEDDINMNYMDKSILFLADGYQGKIKPIYFEQCK